MADVLPVDASLEDIEVDPNLPFLDGFVQIAIVNGAVRYSPPSHLVNIILLLFYSCYSCYCYTL